jgi:hypothetical protein
MNNEPTTIDPTTAVPEQSTPPPEVPKRDMSRRRLGVLLVLLSSIALLLLFQRPLQDWMMLRGYQPAVAVSSLAADSTMTPEATRYFYVNRPAINDKLQFAKNCPTKREQTIVIGCYHSNQAGIYILNVADPRLNGVMQVTAAHEMLHAAYDRLSRGERQRVDKLLQQYYDSLRRDDRIRTTVDSYRKTEPNDLLNEMHSIFGTEVSQLPPELEAYYQQYFTERSKVVGYANHYAAEFISRREQVAAYDAQLTTMRQQIDAQTATLEQQSSSLTQTRLQLESERATSDPASFNARVRRYNDEVAAYNALATRTRQLVADYNDIVKKRNDIALEEQELVQAIQGDTVPADK